MWSPYFQSIPEFLRPLFIDSAFLWQPLDRLADFLQKNLKPANQARLIGSVHIEGNVQIGEGTVVEHGAVIKGPTIIGKNCEIRSGAYIRGQVVVGDKSVIGHTTEVVRSIIMDGVHLDHFSYVGDSILGSRVHFGAGAKVANLRFDQKNITVDGEDTGRVKFGGIFGDNVQLGVNVAVGPGVILEKGSWLTLPYVFSERKYTKVDLKNYMFKAKP